MLFYDKITVVNKRRLKTAMSKETEIIKLLSEEISYRTKTRTLNVVNQNFNGGKRMGSKARAAFSEYAFAELRLLCERVYTVSTYREKDWMISYGEQLVELIRICYKNPADLPSDEVTYLKRFMDVINKERVLENEIIDAFSDGKTPSKEEIERLISIASTYIDEYHRASFFAGMLHFSDSFSDMDDDAAELLRDYSISELERISAKAEHGEDENDALGAICALSEELMTDELADAVSRAALKSAKSVMLYAFESLVLCEKDVPAELVNTLVFDPEYTALIYRAYEKLDKTDLLPAGLLSEENIAKSDMIRWLVYPTELGELPEEIEFVGKAKKKKETYYIFKYRTFSNNLDDSLKGEWLVGWTHDTGFAFSEFEKLSSFEKATLDKTLKSIARKCL